MLRPAAAPSRLLSDNECLSSSEEIGPLACQSLLSDTTSALSMSRCLSLFVDAPVP